LVDLVAVFAPLTALTFWCTGMYRGSWRVAGVADLAKAGGAALAVTVLGAALYPLLSFTTQPASVFLIYGLVAVVLMIASRASYVVLRSSQRRASHQGAPALVYGAGKHGIAAAQELFENRAAGLKPIAFVDDDHEKTGRLVNGLPVLGRSYDLESLITSHGVKAIVIAVPVSAECHGRIVNASGRFGIGVFRMSVQLEQLLEHTVDLPQFVAREASIAEASSVVPVLESEPCAKCGGRNVHRSHARGIYERLRKAHTPARPFRCEDCGWRGWLLPVVDATPLSDVAESDLRLLDVAFSSLAPVGDSPSVDR
jgi:FlaA1/EpsC-like NDP-sugar epimerase